jgi:hyperosmotically inducible protein
MVRDTSEKGFMAATLESLATSLQYQQGMACFWARLASVALAALLTMAVGGVTTAHARSIGEIIDDTRIAAEVMAKLAADSPSNFVKINVKSESGVVTLDGNVDSPDRRARAAQIASGVNGVKGLVNNIQVAGATPTSTDGSSVGSSAIDATGTIASVDPATGTITLTDGRVIRANDRTAVYQPTNMRTLKPGDRVLVRGATPMTARAPEMRLGTVARVDSAAQALVLSDGTIIRVPASAVVHRGSERLALGQIEPGSEIVVQVAPSPSASPAPTAPHTTPPSPTSAPAPNAIATLDASDVNVVWTPSTATATR